MNQNDVDALFNTKRVEDAIPDDSPASSPLEPLKTFRKFITDTRNKLGKHLSILKDKELQLIKLHKLTLEKIKKTKRINEDAMMFFEQRKRDYEAMVRLVLSKVNAGLIVRVPSFGSMALQ